jgi:hypothetical protein
LMTSREWGDGGSVLKFGWNVSYVPDVGGVPGGFAKMIPARWTGSVASAGNGVCISRVIEKSRPGELENGMKIDESRVVENNSPALSANVAREVFHRVRSLHDKVCLSES